MIVVVVVVVVVTVADAVAAVAAVVEFCPSLPLPSFFSPRAPSGGGERANVRTDETNT